MSAPRTVLLVSHVGINLARFRAALIRELVARGDRVVAAVPDAAHDAELAALGAEVRHYGLARGSLNPARLLSPVRSLRRLVRDIRPDVAHSFTHQPNILCRLAVPAGTALVNSVTGLGSCFLGAGPKGEALRRAFHLLYRATARKAAAVIFQNRDDLGHFQSHGLLGPARAELVRGTGVDTAAFRPGLLSPEEREAVRAELGLAPGQVAACLAARLIRDKGVFEFLEAARLLAARHPDLRFVLVGEADPGNPTSLSEADMAAARAAGNVLFAGWRTDMDRIWAASDIAVLPSYREGLPVSLQEALACGLPAVAADAPGCREAVADGSNGFLVPVRDAAALAAALGRLAGDPALRARMGEAGRAKALAEFDAAVLARQIAALYDTLAQPAPILPTPLWKRGLDLALVLGLAPLWLPLLGLLCLLVRRRLGSPVFFRQERPGRGGAPFTLIKLRTMTDARGPDGRLLPDAERLPAFGRWLRSTSLDELPELLNVLRGEMSLVGPRPLLMEYLPLYSPEQARRHAALPGVTGWAQVNGRNALSWPDVFRLDLEYVARMSLGLDLRILWLTISRVLAREGVAQPGRATRDKFRGER
ncbi:MAG: sugar transferase [Thermodesulfobacteriota bacterium]